MDYQFYMRDLEGKSSVRATASVGVDANDNTSVEWSGPQADKFKRWLSTENFLLLGEKFNPAKGEHWRMLPKLLSGHRLWVVVESPGG